MIDVTGRQSAELLWCFISLLLESNDNSTFVSDEPTAPAAEVCSTHWIRTNSYGCPPTFTMENQSWLHTLLQMSQPPCSQNYREIDRMKLWLSLLAEYKLLCQRYTSVYVQIWRMWHIQEKYVNHYKLFLVLWGVILLIQVQIKPSR